MPGTYPGLRRRTVPTAKTMAGGKHLEESGPDMETAPRPTCQPPFPPCAPLSLLEPWLEPYRHTRACQLHTALSGPILETFLVAALFQAHGLAAGAGFFTGGHLLMAWIARAWRRDWELRELPGLAARDAAVLVFWWALSLLIFLPFGMAGTRVLSWWGSAAIHALVNVAVLTAKLAVERRFAELEALGPWRPLVWFLRPLLPDRRTRGSRIEITKHVAVDGVEVPITLSLEKFNPDSSLGRAWKGLTERSLRDRVRFVHALPVNMLPYRHTFVAVAADDPDLGREFLKYLRTPNPLLRQMLRRSHLFILRDGEVVRAVEGASRPLDGRYGKEIVAILERARRYVQQLAKEGAERQEAAGRLKGVAFFDGRLPAGGDPRSLAAGPGAPGKLIAVQGDIGHRRSRSLVRELPLRAGPALERLGHVFIRFKQGKNPRILAEHEEQTGALQEVQKLVDGFHTLVSFSDTHFGDGSDRDKLGLAKRQELVEILQWAAQRSSVVVLNGDGLELLRFVYDAIRESAANQPVFEAFRSLHDFKVVAGNHDDVIRSDAFDRRHAEIVEEAQAATTGEPGSCAAAFDARRYGAALAAIQDLKPAPGRICFTTAIPFSVAHDARQGILYVDETLRDRPGELAERIRHAGRDVSLQFQRDVGERAEVVTFFMDLLRGLYFEHGDDGDGTIRDSRTIRIALRVEHLLMGLGFRGIEPGLQAAIGLGVRLVRWLWPPALARETRGYCIRLTGTALLLQWYAEARGFKDKRTFEILYGHTHDPFIHEGIVHEFVSELTGGRVRVSNSGTWASSRSPAEERLLPPNPLTAPMAEANAGRCPGFLFGGYGIGAPQRNPRDWIAIKPDNTLLLHTNGAEALRTAAPRPHGRPGSASNLRLLHGADDLEPAAGSPLDAGHPAAGTTRRPERRRPSPRILPARRAQ